ncbi:MAG TPA: HAD-IA family hydrolase [Geobacteraceae bacterium]
MNGIGIAAILARRHWVFDLDGTLTLPVHDFAAIRAELGVPDGVDILGFLASLPPAAAQPLHEKLQTIEDRLALKTAAAAGAVHFIERLHHRGDRLGVLTRNTRENALRTLELIGVGHYFPPDCVLGRAEALPKPEPDGVRKLSALWCVSPSALVMVGDYLFDLQAGQAAGAATVHVHGDRPYRWPEWTDLCVPTLEELAKRLPA